MTEKDRLSEGKHKPDVLDIPNATFEAIRKGRKVIEGRVSSETKDYSLLEEGDTITFFNKDTNERLCTTINGIRHYSGTREMLEAEGIERVMTNPTTIEDGIARYNSFPGYEGNIQKHGIYAIEFAINTDQ